jgi:CHAT domain-containing protein
VGADREVASLASLLPTARTLTGSKATVAATGSALANAPIAHLACHGRFRSDNPLFSGLVLHDGHLTVYDLEQVGSAPRLMVLSACESGVSAARPGEELLGLVTALCSLGTDAVVASVVPVPDLDTTQMMVALHHEMAGGASPSLALARARAAVDEATAGGLVTSLAFTCFGRDPGSDEAPVEPPAQV